MKQILIFFITLLLFTASATSSGGSASLLQTLQQIEVSLDLREHTEEEVNWASHFLDLAIQVFSLNEEWTSTLGSKKKWQLYKKLNELLFLLSSQELSVAQESGLSSHLQDTLHWTQASAGLADLQLSGEPPHDFGMVAFGTTKIHHFVLTNHGFSAATNLKVSLAPLFEKVKELEEPHPLPYCEERVPARSSCRVSVSMTGAAQGVVFGYLTLYYSDGQNAQQIGRPIYGVGK